jgi:hypothetical protein
VLRRGHRIGRRAGRDGALRGGLALPAAGEVVREQQYPHGYQDQHHGQDREWHYGRPCFLERPAASRSSPSTSARVFPSPMGIILQLLLPPRRHPAAAGINCGGVIR